MTTGLTLKSTKPIEQVEETLAFLAMPRAQRDKVNTVLEKISSTPSASIRGDALLVDVKQEPALAEKSIVVAKSASSDLISLATRILEAADAVFTAIKQKYDSVSTPLSIVKTSLDWAALIPSLENLAGVVNKSIGEVTAPFKLIKLIDKLKKMHKILFKTPVESAEATKFTEIASLGFALVSSACSVLSWLQKIGMITPAIALAARTSILANVCDLMAAAIDVGDNVQNFTTSANLAKAILKFTAAAITVVLIAYTAANLKILLLTIGTGTLILNIAVPDEKVKQPSIKEAQ